MTEPTPLPDFDRLWDFDEPAKAERRFRELLPSAETAGDRSYYAQLLTQIARAEGLQRKFDDALRTLDEVQPLLADALARARVRYLLERGRVFNSAGQPARARPLFAEAWEVARAHGEDADAVDAAHMMAIVVDPSHQLDWHLAALDLAERSPDERARRWLGSLLNNIGWSYHDLGRYPEALAAFDRALACRLAAGQESEIRIASWSVARALRSLGRLDEAVVMQRALLTDLDARGEVDGYVLEELAECLLVCGDEAEARAFAARAHAELAKDSWLAANEPERLRRLQTLGSRQLGG